MYHSWILALTKKSLFLYCRRYPVHANVSEITDVRNTNLPTPAMYSTKFRSLQIVIQCSPSFGRHTESTEHYSINNVELENVESTKDLGVIFDSHSQVGLRMSKTSNTAYSILGIIRRNFTFLDKESF